MESTLSSETLKFSWAMQPPVSAGKSTHSRLTTFPLKHRSAHLWPLMRLLLLQGDEGHTTVSHLCKTCVSSSGQATLGAQAGQPTGTHHTLCARSACPQTPLPASEAGTEPDTPCPGCSDASDPRVLLGPWLGSCTPHASPQTLRCHGRAGARSASSRHCTSALGSYSSQLSDGCVTTACASLQLRNAELFQNKKLEQRWAVETI